MNIKNVKKLLAHLVKQQKSRKAARFNMRYWGNQCTGKDNGLTEVLRTPVCKTQACLAGETILALGAGKVRSDGGIDVFGCSGSLTIIQPTAVKLLNLTDDERKRLFHFRSWGLVDGWPDKFENAYNKAKTPVKRLGVAIQRLRHFIKTNGAE